MRIRRRPPGQPLAYLLPSDPPAPQPPQAAPGDRQERPVGDGRREGPVGRCTCTRSRPRISGSVTGAPSPVKPPALLPLLPKDSVVERGRGLGAQQHQQGPAENGLRSSLENGRHHVPEPVIKAGERLSLSNGAAVAVVVAVATTVVGANATKQQQETKDNSGGGASKKPRCPDKLMVGSRCSRKNGRGWRCSQATMVGYALCQYHLGKGRVRAAADAAARRVGVVGHLGRTENGKRTSFRAAAAPAAPPPPPPPKAEVPTAAATDRAELLEARMAG